MPSLFSVLLNNELQKVAGITEKAEKAKKYYEEKYNAQPQKSPEEKYNAQPKKSLNEKALDLVANILNKYPKEVGMPHARDLLANTIANEAQKNISPIEYKMLKYVLENQLKNENFNPIFISNEGIPLLSSVGAHDLSQLPTFARGLQNKAVMDMYRVNDLIYRKALEGNQFANSIARKSGGFPFLPDSAF